MIFGSDYILLVVVFQDDITIIHLNLKTPHVWVEETEWSDQSVNWKDLQVNRYTIQNLLRSKISDEYNKRKASAEKSINFTI